MQPVFDIRFTIFICCVLHHLCSTWQMFNAETIFRRTITVILVYRYKKKLKKKNIYKKRKRNTMYKKARVKEREENIVELYNTALKFTDTESNKNEFFSTPRIDLEPSDNFTFT